MPFHEQLSVISMDRSWAAFGTAPLGGQEILYRSSMKPWEDEGVSRVNRIGKRRVVPAGLWSGM